MSTRERKRRFDALFASYGSDIVAYCGWRSASTSDAQDAAADVFLTAWRRLDEVPEDAAKVWLEAADPAALLDAALTVGADGVVREIALSWGT